MVRVCQEKKRLEGGREREEGEVEDFVTVVFYSSYSSLLPSCPLPFIPTFLAPFAMPLVSLSRVGDIHILRLTAGENRFGLDMVRALNDALDQVEKTVGQGNPGALVTTGEGKFFSNGLDLDYVLAGHADFLPVHFEPLLKRFLTFPIPTVAALNGHAFAGGCLLAMAHDYRVMQTGKGFLCMNGACINYPSA